MSSEQQEASDELKEPCQAGSGAHLVLILGRVVRGVAVVEPPEEAARRRLQA